MLGLSRMTLGPQAWGVDGSQSEYKSPFRRGGILPGLDALLPYLPR